MEEGVDGITEDHLGVMPGFVHEKIDDFFDLAKGRRRFPDKAIGVTKLPNLFGHYGVDCCAVNDLCSRLNSFGSGVHSGAHRTSQSPSGRAAGGEPSAFDPVTGTSPDASPGAFDRAGRAAQRGENSESRSLSQRFAGSGRGTDAEAGAEASPHARRDPRRLDAPAKPQQKSKSMRELRTCEAELLRAVERELALHREPPKLSSSSPDGGETNSGLRLVPYAAAPGDAFAGTDESGDAFEANSGEPAPSRTSPKAAGSRPPVRRAGSRDVARGDASRALQRLQESVEGPDFALEGRLRQESIQESIHSIYRHETERGRRRFPERNTGGNPLDDGWGSLGPSTSETCESNQRGNALKDTLADAKYNDLGCYGRGRRIFPSKNNATSPGVCSLPRLSPQAAARGAAGGASAGESPFGAEEKNGGTWSSPSTAVGDSPELSTSPELFDGAISSPGSPSLDALTSTAPGASKSSRLAESKSSPALPSIEPRTPGSDKARGSAEVLQRKQGFRQLPRKPEELAKVGRSPSLQGLHDPRVPASPWMGAAKAAMGEDPRYAAIQVAGYGPGGASGGASGARLPSRKKDSGGEGGRALRRSQRGGALPDADGSLGSRSHTPSDDDGGTIGTRSGSMGVSAGMSDSFSGSPGVGRRALSRGALGDSGGSLEIDGESAGVRAGLTVNELVLEANAPGAAGWVHEKTPNRHPKKAMGASASSLLKPDTSALGASTSNMSTKSSVRTKGSHAKKSVNWAASTFSGDRGASDDDDVSDGIIFLGNAPACVRGGRVLRTKPSGLFGGGPGGGEGHSRERPGPALNVNLRNGFCRAKDLGWQSVVDSRELAEGPQEPQAAAVDCAEGARLGNAGEGMKGPLSGSATPAERASLLWGVDAAGGTAGPMLLD